MKISSSKFWRVLAVVPVISGMLLTGLATNGRAAQPAGETRQESVLNRLSAGETAIQGPFVDEPVYPAVFNGDLRDLPQVAPEAPAPIPLRYVPGQEPKGSAPQIAGWVDSVAQTEFGDGQMPPPVANFAGLDFNGFGAGWPPDTNGDVGPNHYIQTVNTSIGIYNKVTGVRLVGVTFDTFFSGPAGTPCDTDNQGDPVVLYDASVDRWLITDFAWFNFNTGPFYECIAVSQTNDPVAGGWYFYALRADTGAFTGYLNDYPKLGVWNDGWYMSANMFQQNPPGPGFGVRAWALDRASMIAGGALYEVHFDTCNGGVCDSLLPANYRGAAPPAGAPNYFLGAVAPGSLNLYEFDVDWATPGNSTFTGPIVIPIAPFAIAPSIPQPSTGTLLDSLSFRLMMQLQYRNINGVESLWANHSVATGGVVGVRWYEIQDPGGAANLIQQGTYQPDSTYRWMGSLAVDQDGNMAVGYSRSSAANPIIYPSILYAGRLAGEAPGLLPQDEATLVTGSGSQNGINRWGDYSAMTVDPLDDCTFWYTTEYYLTTGTNWQTRIGSFKFPSCGQPKGTLTGTVYNAVTNQPVPGVNVSAASLSTTFTAQTDSNGDYSMDLLGGAYDVTAGPLLPGYPSSTTVNGVSVVAGNTTNQDLYLDPAPYLVGAATSVDDNGLGGNGNGFPEPGEQGILLFQDLLNTGAVTSTNITALLSSSTAGVTVDQDATSYLDIPAGAFGANSIPYAFSIDYAVPCGSDLDFHTVMTDSVSVYSSDFTLNASVALPRTDIISNTVESGAAGWTTGGTSNTWAITTLSSHSPTHSWTDSPAGAYVDNTNSYLRTPAFDLSGKRNVVISGWYLYELESGYDYVYLEYSLNGGGTWQTASPLASFNGFQSSWENLVVDAAVLDNQANVALRYRLVSDSGVTADGIYIDDVAVSYEPYSCDYTPPLLPGAPNLLSPLDGAQVTNPVTFTWEDSGAGDLPSGYIFNLDNTPVMTFTTPVTSTTMTLTSGVHTWSVVATNLAGPSPASETRTVEILVVLNPPGVPNLLSPADNSLVAPGQITFTWEDSGSGGAAEGFALLLDNSLVVNFTTPVTSTAIILGSGAHTWSVKATNASGESIYAPERTLWVQFRALLPIVLNNQP